MDVNLDGTAPTFSEKRRGNSAESCRSFNRVNIATASWSDPTVGV